MNKIENRAAVGQIWRPQREEAIQRQESENVIAQDQKTNADASADKTAAVLDKLKQHFKGMQIVVGSLKDTQDIRDYALKHLGGSQIVISQEALERMGEDESFMQKCMEAIRAARSEQTAKVKKLPGKGKIFLGSGIYLNDEGETAQWVASRNQKPVSQKVKSYSEKAVMAKGDTVVYTFRSKNGVITIKKKLTYRPANDLGKLARAMNQQMVKSTMSGVRAQINMFKRSGCDREVVASLTKQAEQVIMRGKLKISLLKKEEILEGQQKARQKKKEYQKAARLRQLLREKKTLRRSREYGEANAYYPTPQEKREKEELERLERKIDGNCYDTGGQIYTPTGDSVSLSGGSGAAAGAAGGAFVDVSV